MKRIIMLILLIVMMGCNKVDTYEIDKDIGYVGHYTYIYFAINQSKDSLDYRQERLDNYLLNNYSILYFNETILVNDKKYHIERNYTNETFPLENDCIDDVVCIVKWVIE